MPEMKEKVHMKERVRIWHLIFKKIERGILFYFLLFSIKPYFLDDKFGFRINILQLSKNKLIRHLF